MSNARPPAASLVLVGGVFALVLFFVGRLAFQWITAEDPGPPPPSFAEQVEALPFVEDVRTESDRITGSKGLRSLESWITLSSDVTSDPAGVAEGLAGVTWGYDTSHWSIEGEASTADVSYRGPVDQAPVRWWTDAVAALADADPEAALHCDISDHALRCEVASSDPGRALQVLSGVDGSAIQPWLAGAHADEGEDKGFSLTVGGETFTDATAVG